MSQTRNTKNIFARFSQWGTRQLVSLWGDDSEYADDSRPASENKSEHKATARSYSEVKETKETEESKLKAEYARTPFKMIYQGAKEKDKKKIEGALVLVSINVLDVKERGAVIRKLAREGDRRSVEFLRKNFNACLYEMISGYAEAKDFVTVNKILSENSDIYFSLLLKAISGFAYSGAVDEVNKILEQLHSSSEEFKLLQKAVRGYAEGGFFDEVEKIWKLAKNFTEERRLELLHAIVIGFIVSGHEQEAEAYLKFNSTDEQNQFLMLESKIKTYAMRGEVTKVNKILASVCNAEKKWTSLSQKAVFGYGVGNHEYEYKALLSSTKDAFFGLELSISMLCGMAYSGFNVGIENLTQTEPDIYAETVAKIVKYYACRNHGEQVQHVLRLVNNSPQLCNITAAAVFGYAQEGYVREATRMSNANPQFPLIAVAAGASANDRSESEATTFFMSCPSDAERLKAVKAMAVGYARAGEYAAMNKMLSMLSVATIPYSLKLTLVSLAERFNSENSALHAVTMFDLYFQKILFNDLNKSREIQENKTVELNQTADDKLIKQKINEIKELKDKKLFSRAAKINPTMKIHHLNFNQGLAWTQPEVSIWLLQGIQLVKKGKLSHDLLLSITSFLSPISAPEAKELSVKFLWQTCPKRFSMNLLTQPVSSQSQNRYVSSTEENKARRLKTS